LGAFCLFLSTIEYMIPKPLPFMRIGIANIPIMLAVDLFTPGTFVILVAIKVLGQALITGTLLSYVFIYSMAGTVVSSAVMYVLRRLIKPKNLSFIGLSTVGALLSNATQLGIAWIWPFGAAARFIAPLLIGVGAASGIVLGFFCEYFTSRSMWYRDRLAQAQSLGRI
jgi:heptaprenyl diphosphate synthase